jgi:Na+/phosphate symporter
LTFFKKREINGWGMTVLGFGFLFLGMGMMGGELKELAKDDSFRSMFRLFECVPGSDGYIPLGSLLGAICVGLVATVVIQSSSACTGIILALGASGLLNLHTAVALVIGSNIGTTITAQLAALTANRVAKQAALAHTLFNVCGALFLLATFFIVTGSGACAEPVFFNMVRYFSANGELPRQIANAHTLFNIFTTVILVPFIGPLALLCERVLPVRETKVKYRRLEPILLDTPHIALFQAVTALRKMLGMAWRSVNCSFKLKFQDDEDNLELAKQLDEIEVDIDERQSDIASYLSRLMAKPITQAQAGIIPQMLHCVNDAERIGDHAIIVRDIFANLAKVEKPLSEEACSEYANIHAKLVRQAQGTLALLAGAEDSVRRAVMTIRDEIMVSAALYEQNHITRMREKRCSSDAGIVYIELLGEIRKVSRHLSNIAERSTLFHSIVVSVPGKQ